MTAQPISPAPGQESVWDYPRPPKVQASSRHIRVIFNDVLIADTRRAFRVLETSHPPVYYIPMEDIRGEYLKSTPRQTFCEFKGRAHYYTVSVGARRAENAAWHYPDPERGYEAIQHHVAFYPGVMDACFVDDERVRAQAGDFYGGWITHEIVGPFKGDPGTQGW